MTDIKTLNSTVVYENKWMTVKEDVIQRTSGATGIFGVVNKPDFAVILPIQNNHIYLVQQYRYPVQARFWELPQGSWESNPNIDHAVLAAAELQEETGLRAGNMTYIGHQYLAYGYSNQGYHMYLASDLQQSNTSLDQEEEDLVSKRFSLQTFESMIRSGDIKDATTCNTYGFAKMAGFIP